MNETLFYIYFAAAPLVIVGLAYLAMRFYGYGKITHHGPAE